MLSAEGCAHKRLAGWTPTAGNDIGEKWKPPLFLENSAYETQSMFRQQPQQARKKKGVTVRVPRTRRSDSLLFSGVEKDGLFGALLHILFHPSHDGRHLLHLAQIREMRHLVHLLVVCVPVFIALVRPDEMIRTSVRSA